MNFPPKLTPRELQVLPLVANERLQNKEIAKRLGCTVRTAKAHVSSLMRKFGAADRYELRCVVCKLAEITGGKPSLP